MLQEPSVVFRIPLFDLFSAENTKVAQDRALGTTEPLEVMGISIEVCNLNERRKPKP